MSTEKTESHKSRLQRAIRHRQAEDKQQMERAIIKAASELFLQHGYEGFSLRQVAEAVGYSPSVMYVYFNDKDDLLFRVVDEGFQHFEQHMQQALTSTQDERQRLLNVMQAYIDFGLKNSVLYQLMFVQRTDFLSQTRHHDTPTRYDQTWNWFEESVEAAMQAGVIKTHDVHITSYTMWAGVHGYVTLALRMSTLQDEAKRLTVAESVCDMILKGLG